MIGQDCLIDCSCKLLNTEVAIARPIKVLEDLSDLLLGQDDILDLGEELKELPEV